MTVLLSAFELVLDSDGCPLPITEYVSTLSSHLQLESNIPGETRVSSEQWDEYARHLPAGAQRYFFQYSL